MLRRLFLWLIGGVTVRITPEFVAEATRASFAKGIPIILGRWGKRGRIVTVRMRDFEIFSALCADAGVEFSVVKRFGVPHILHLYGRRWGLILGGVVLVFAIFIADDYVWRIDVSGNENVPTETIIAELDALGFRLGTAHKNIDYDVLHNRFLLASPDIAWIAVNMKGSVARVEVREYIPGKREEKKGYANIVAECDGIITQVSDFAGSPQVKIGDEVKKGQLLISGAVEYEGVGGELVYAEGEVYAEVTRQISVKMPLVTEQIVKTGENQSNFAIKIFSKTIFFGTRGRIDPTSCDTITVKHDVVLPGTVILPITVIEERSEGTKTVTVTHTPEQAAAEAYRQFKLAFIEACRDVTLLSYEMTDGMNEAGDAYEIECTIRVIDDIAVTQPFEAAD